MLHSRDISKKSDVIKSFLVFWTLDIATLHSFLTAIVEDISES